MIVTFAIAIYIFPANKVHQVHDFSCSRRVCIIDDRCCACGSTFKGSSNWLRIIDTRQQFRGDPCYMAIDGEKRTHILVSNGRKKNSRAVGLCYSLEYNIIPPFFPLPVDMYLFIEVTTRCVPTQCTHAHSLRVLASFTNNLCHPKCIHCGELRLPTVLGREHSFDRRI
jgi:hypothetical protein